jgi:hypothetical protein
MSNGEPSLANASPAKTAEKRRQRDDLALLIFVSVFVLFNSALYYLGVHYNKALPLIFISALAALLITGFVGCLFIFRIVTLRLLRSPLLLVSAAILAGQLVIYRVAVHAIDLFRLYSNMSFYEAVVEASNTSPRFVTFDWGSSGFAGSSSWYYLLFDETGHAANPPPGMISTAESLKPEPNCFMSISHLSGHFYSAAVSC